MNHKLNNHLNLEHDLNRWTDCPPGEISQMVQRSLSARRREKMRKLGASASLALLLLFITVGGALTYRGAWSNPPTDPTLLGNLNCGQVQILMAAYHDHKLESDMHQRVSLHLTNCPGCRRHYKQAHPRKKSLDAPTTKKPVPTIVAALTPFVPLPSLASFGN